MKAMSLTSGAETDGSGAALFDKPSFPAQRADIAIAAMRHGKDVLLDKPGVTSDEQLQRVRAMCAQSDRIFSICFSERHIVPAVEHALKLVQDGAIGTPSRPWAWARTA